ncbi:MAG: hypothetical protein JXN61_06930 [Sedimentisphaerales bacterium]|nr:hypothetical protein [Sedimentisphaerales bacterium]
MKNCTSILMVICCVFMAGCGGGAKQANSLELDRNRINSGLVNSYNDLAMQNAIIAQCTLYPYHFIKNSAELNELGQRDLAVLAGHFKEYPGQLNIRRDDLPAEIYGARVNHTLDLLKKAGVDAERISVSDGMPGGSGMASERVLRILAAAEGQDNKTESATYTTGVQQ